MEPVAQKLQHLHLRRGRTTVGGSHLASQRVGGLTQGGRQGVVNLCRGDIQAILAGQQLRAVVADLDDSLRVEVPEHGQIPHQAAHGLQLAIGHPPLGRRNQDHGVDQGGMMIEFLAHSFFRWR